MREDGELFFLLFLGAMAIGLVIGITLGIKLTRSDIYSRCVDQNKTMVYEEVHKLCIERSR
jgi:ABC-type proline/glycine betaine transport system permease subunit